MTGTSGRLARSCEMCHMASSQSLPWMRRSVGLRNSARALASWPGERVIWLEAPGADRAGQAGEEHDGAQQQTGDPQAAARRYA